MTGEVLKSKYQQLFTEVLDCLEEGSITKVIGFSGNGCLRKADAFNFGGDSGTSQEKSGNITLSSNGLATSFAIYHGFSSAPSVIHVNAGSVNASGFSHITKDNTNIYVNYSVAPPVGNNNLSFYWTAKQ